MSIEILDSTSRLAHSGVSILVQTILLPNQTVREKLVIQHPGAVAIIPFLDDGRVVLIRQYRLAAQSTLLEIPAGTLEIGENPRDCAERELQEEAGYFPDTLESLGHFYVAPGMSTEIIHLFVARNLRPSQLEKDEDELIEVVPMSLIDARSKITTGEITDAKTIIGLLRIQL